MVFYLFSVTAQCNLLKDIKEVCAVVLFIGIIIGLTINMSN